MTPALLILDLDDDELPRLARYLTSIRDVANYRRLEKRTWRSAVA